MSAGGTGGTLKTLTLDSDEYVNQVILYKNNYNNGQRIFYAEFKTNKGRSLSGGKKSGSSITLNAPQGYYLAGFFGRAGANVDKLGIIWKSLPLSCVKCFMYNSCKSSISSTVAALISKYIRPLSKILLILISDVS